jgi:tetratricopeptide (TPR) repeat protein
MRRLLLVFGLVFSLASQSQPKGFTFVEDGDEHFRHRNFLSAIPIYDRELKNDPENLKVRYRLGLCYLNTRVNRQQAVSLLEEVARDPDVGEDVFIHLGKAYLLSNRLDEAILTFEKFASLKPRRADEVEHYLEQCQNALEMMTDPVNVSFQNLGKEINSSEPDYYPFIDKDEMTLVFTTRRKENFGGKKIEIDGYRSSDVYQSTMHNGHWTEAKNIGRNINGILDEQVVGMRPDGLEMYVYLDHIEKYGDLYVAGRNDLSSDFSRPKRCDAIINEEIESSGCMTEDGNLMIFARRDKLNDNSDLYISHRLPNGKWGIPQLLPDVINTAYNEDMPYLSYDGKTLYFASEGHSSMGGYDLFKTTWDQEANTFSKPENLGYPINSTDDDRSICVTRDNKLAYVSSFREEGFGDLDIYRVKFDDTEPVSVIYTGNFILGDSAAAKHVKHYDVRITVTDTRSNAEYRYIPQSKTGRYVMALPAGTYKLVTYSKGYARYREDLVVSDMGRVNLERHKDFHLRKLNHK